MSWEKVQFSDVINDITGGNRKFQTLEYLSSGLYPIVDQSENFIGGYTNIESVVKRKKDVVIFGDHTKVLKYVDFDFCIGADGIKVLEPVNGLNTKYLYYFLKTIKFPNVGYSRHFKFLKDLQIPLPPLSTQKRIAEILDAADALRRKDQELLRKYEELAQAIFIDMFGDPVKNEKGWEVAAFGTLFDSRLGKMLDIKKQQGNIKYKYLGNSNVQWFKFQLENLAEMEFNDKELETLELRNGDILICEGGEVGRAAIWRNENERIYFQKAIHRARAKKDNITPEYTVMLFWFYAKFGGLKDFVTSSTISHLTGEKIKTIPIPVPPILLQREYEKVVAILKKQVDCMALYSSDNLFQTLLQKAFKGELIA